MTEKRYFKKEWEEEYYIFDSENISEKEFEEKYDYEDYRAFEDSMMGYEVVNRLNEQHETIQVLKASNGEMEDYFARLEEKNEQLKQQKDKWKQQCIHFKEMLDDMDIAYLCDEWIYDELKGDVE